MTLIQLFHKLKRKEKLNALASAAGGFSQISPENMPGAFKRFLVLDRITKMDVLE